MNKLKRMLHYLNLLIFGFDGNEDIAFNLLTKIGNRILPHYRFSYPQMVWWRDSDLNQIFGRFEELGGFNTHRKFTLLQLLRLTSNLDGDTAECGVYKGASSFLMLFANRNSKLNKAHHIFDSFEGLSEPGHLDGKYWKTGDLTVSERLVIDMLDPFVVNKDFFCYQGWIPTRFNEVGDIKFSFVHVDVDLFQPTLDSIEFFYDKIVSGGIFLCDDYGFTTCPGATNAIDQFLANRIEKMICLPCGGGFFIKGIHVS